MDRQTIYINLAANQKVLTKDSWNMTKGNLFEIQKKVYNKISKSVTLTWKLITNVIAIA